MTDDFSLEPGLIYLNHAAVSPWPVQTVAAVRQFAEESGRLGSSHYPAWLEVEARLRQRLSRLIGMGNEEDIALLKNTSEGLSLVAHGLAWQGGENVVISDQEFPSNQMVWESLDRYGVTVRKAAIESVEDPEQALFDQVDEQTRLIAISSVQFGTGLRMDLPRIGAFCRQHQILFCVDAIQSLGALQFDGPAIQPDFVVADGHKWMMAPEGCALFYSRPESRKQLQLYQFGWHMREYPFEFDPLDRCDQGSCCGDSEGWQAASSARCFEPGSPNMVGIHGLEASMALLESHGMAAVEQAVLEHTGWLMRQVDARPDFQLLSDRREARRSGMVTFCVPSVDAGRLFERLTEAGVQCALRGGGIRFSPHYYTPQEELERVMMLCDTLVDELQQE